MERIELAATGRTTTRLGFGCSNLMGGLNRKESTALLDAAWDAGIRHYDVASGYGWGAAEGCVGDFLARHPGEATVTTKFGILPPQRESLVGLARKAARPLIRAVPGIKQRLSKVASTTLSGSKKSLFTAAEGRASLERSLKELKTDAIDLWLLHDPDAASLTDPGLLDLMMESRQAGRIREFGVSNDVAKIPALYEQRRGYCRVLQFEWSVREKVPDYPGSYRIHHRSLAQSFQILRALLQERPDLCRRWSDEVDRDLSSADNLSALMLKAALMMNPQSIILVSSKKPAHIVANVKTAEDETLGDAAVRFYQLVRQQSAA